MPLLIQNILVLGFVAACGGFALWQAIRSLRGSASRLGSCCARGCGQTSKPTTQKIIFLPADMLRRR